MSSTRQESLEEQAWRGELAQRNQRGAKVAVALVLALYPAFGFLDYLIAPAETLPLLLTSRVVVVAASLLMWWRLRAPLGHRHALLTSGYMYLVALGICVMVYSLGGLTSPYYAGLNLVMIGTGLLYIWPLHVSASLNAGIFLSWLIPSLCFGDTSTEIEALISAVSNGVFLFATACITTAGQTFNYHRVFSQHQTQHTLEQTSGALHEAHEELKQQEAFKSRFFANITHELKTPLALILSTLELLQRGELGERLDEQLTALQQIERSGGKLLRLINDLLDISKLEESRLQLDVSERELVSWVAGVVGDVRPLAERKKIKVVMRATSPDLHIYCDLHRLERVLVNLLSNAIKFTPEEGEVTVQLLEREGSVQLSVRDTGQGFTPEQASRLFDRFYQTDMGATRKHGGTGLGLTLAKELIELHHGAIWATGELGVGACFTVELLKGSAHFDGSELARGARRAQDERDEPEVMSIRQITGEQPLPTQSTLSGVELTRDVTLEQGPNHLQEIEEVSERRVIPRDADEDERGATVLIAEDHPDITKMIHLALKRHFKVVAAPNGAKALELVERFKPDLVITDLMMPVMDGIELTESLKRDPKTQHIPVIMLSARDQIREEMEARGFVADAYMSKPFSTRALGKLARATVRVSPWSTQSSAV